MECITTKEASINWNISTRRIVTLCKENRIKNAKLIGNTWLIPANAEKPIDARLKNGKYLKKQLATKNLKEIINNVFESDCLIKMKEIPDESIDMILCDLPYGITQNDWDCYIPLDSLWKEYNRIIKKDGVIALTSVGIFTAKLIMSNPTMYKYSWIWEKSKATNFLNAKKQPLRKHEDICIFYKSQPTYNPQMTSGESYDKGIRKNQLSGNYGTFKPMHVKSDGQRYPTDIIYCKTAESEGKVLHPTQKPVELGRYLIKTYTNPGDVVLDNTCGSGSFLVAAMMEGRNFIGIEKNENTSLFKKEFIDYIEVCKDRLKESWMTLNNSTKNLLYKSNLIRTFEELL